MVAGSAVVKYMLYDSPAAAQPSPPDVTPDTSANIDATDAAYLSTLTPAQRDAYKATVVAENAAMTASITPAPSSGGAAAPPASSPSPSAPSELTSMLLNLAAGVKSGALQAQTNMAVLSFAVDGSSINALSAADLAALNAAIDQINADCTLNGQGCPPPQGASPSPSSDAPSSPNNMPIIIGASVGGGVPLVAAIVGAAVLIKRKDASRRLRPPPESAEGAKRHKSETASESPVEDLAMGAGAGAGAAALSSPAAKKSLGFGNSNRVSPAPSATGGSRPDMSPRISAAGVAVGASASALAAAEDGSAPPSPARSPLGRPTSGSGAATPVHRLPSASGATLDTGLGVSAAAAAGPKILNPRPESRERAAPQVPTEDPNETHRFGLPGAPSGASMNYRTYVQLAGGSGEGGGMIASSTGPTGAMPPPPGVAAASAAAATGSPRKTAALPPVAEGSVPPARASATGEEPRASAMAVPQKPYNRLPALGAQKATLAPLGDARPSDSGK